MRSVFTALGIFPRFPQLPVNARCRWVILASVLFAAGLPDLALLTHYDFSIGIDGYYYFLQVNDLRSQGHLYFHSATPVVFYFIDGISYLTGSTALAIKVGAILLHISLCLGIAAVLAGLTRSEWIGLAGGTLAAVSGLRLYMLSEFIATLAAICLLVWCAWCAIKLFQTRRGAWALSAAALLLAALFSHRLSLVIVIGLAIFAGLLHWMLVQDRAMPYRRYVALLFLTVMWLSPAILAAQPFLRRPEWLNDELSIIPRLPFDQYALSEEIALFVFSSLILFLLVYFRKRPTGLGVYILGAVALWSLVVTLNPFLNPDRGWLSIAGRLRGLSYIQTAILVPAVAWYLLRARRELVVYVGAVAVPLAVLSAGLPKPRGLQADYLSERAQMAANLPDHRQQLGPNPIVIAAHGDEFLVTSLLGIPSQHTPPVNTNYQNIYWLLHQAQNRDFGASSIVVKPDSQSASTVLIQDRELRERLAQMAELERHRLFAVNPHLARANP